MPAVTKQSQTGFTLIELIVGIVLFAIAIVYLTSLILPQSKNGIEPIWQVRAATLAESLANEILAKAFDERSIRNSGLVACNVGQACSDSSQLGPDANEIRSNYDDIDDYNGLVLSGIGISNSASTTFSAETGDLFLGFDAIISVVYDDDMDGINDDDLNNDGNLDSGNYSGNKKLITIIVTTPGGEDIIFSSYRDNF